MEGSLKRVRLFFQDPGILRKSQLSQGLQRSWLVLPPNIATVSELARYVAASFKLCRSVVADDLLLSLEGFVLPSFESAVLIEDKDIISVRTKAKKIEEDTRRDNYTCGIEDNEILDTNPNISCENFLTTRWIQERPEGHMIEINEDMYSFQDHPLFENVLLKGKTNLNEKRVCPSKHLVSNYLNPTSDRKRKHLLKCSGLKHIEHTRKKQKLTHVEKPIHVNVEGSDLEQGPRCSLQPGNSEGKLQTEEKPSHENCTTKQLNSSTVEATIDVIVNDTVCSSPSEDRSNQLLKDHKRHGCEMPDNGVTRKISRSTRRKKAKRRYLRALANFLKSEQAKREVPADDMVATSSDSKEKDKDAGLLREAECNGKHHDSDIDGDVVPVVVRPGYIRFKPVGATQQTEPQPYHETKIMQWTGTTNKKKGQKWGRESTSRNKFDRDTYDGGEASDGDIAEEIQPVVAPVDFERLPALNSRPKEGNIVAYRLVELSSSMCPELSPFRIGRVGAYDHAAAKIVLLPVPSYPIFREGEGELASESGFSSYGEDGSLEINFQSLVDVRTLEPIGGHRTQKPGSSASAAEELAAPPASQPSAPFSGQAANVGTAAAATGDNPYNSQEELQLALDPKRTEIQKNNSSGPWSFRALRGSAMGPTIALLRASNDL